MSTKNEIASSNSKSLKRKEQFANKFYNKFKEVAGNDYELLEEYVNCDQLILIRHKCGTEFRRKTGTILYNNSCFCPLCYSKHCKGTVSGVNDIHSTNKYIESILDNPNDAYKYSQFSHEKVWFRCPICGERLYKKISTVAINGLGCTFCGKGTSFAERFMIHFLRYYNVKFEYQFSPDWIDKKRYDFKFEYNNSNYILEIDGGWHELDNKMSGVTAEQQKEIDLYKENMAFYHGFKVLRLDYAYNNKTKNKEQYLKESILKSELTNLFVITEKIIDDLLLITKSKEAVSQRVYDVAKEWNKLKDKNLRNLKHVCDYYEDGLRSYLYKAFELGLINESPEEIKLLNRKAQFTNGKDTRCHYAICDQTGEIMNYTEAREKYRANLFRYFQNENYIHTGKLSDGTKLTWKKYNNLERRNLI